MSIRASLSVICFASFSCENKFFRLWNNMLSFQFMNFCFDTVESTVDKFYCIEFFSNMQIHKCTNISERWTHIRKYSIAPKTKGFYSKRAKRRAPSEGDKLLNFSRFSNNKGMKRQLMQLFERKNYLNLKSLPKTELYFLKKQDFFVHWIFEGK